MAIQKFKDNKGEWVIVSGINKPFTIDSSMSNESINPVQNKVVKDYIDYAIQNVEIDVDSEVSSESTNPVQNKVIKEYIDNAVLNVEIDVDDALSNESTNPVQNKVIKETLDAQNKTIQEELDLKANISDVVIDEEVTASAFNDVNDRVILLNDNLIQNYSLKSEVEKITEDFTKNIIDNEEVLASAINDLNDRLVRLTEIVNGLINN